MTEEQRQECREDGMIAFEEGKGIWQCPYTAGEQYDAWRDGYDYAHFMTA